MLNKILKGTDRRSQVKLDRLIEKIGENPNIAWYPSAGNDFRDLIEVDTRTSVSPDLYFHTDFMVRDQKFTVGPLVDIDGNLVTINNGEYSGEIMEINYLTCTDNINYYVNPEFILRPECARNEPTILLLDVLVNKNGVQIRKPVLYWYFENINFLDEVLLKFKIPISHIYKHAESVEGTVGSIALSYAFVSNLKTQYLLSDNILDINFTLLNDIKVKHLLNLKNFKLHNVEQVRNFIIHPNRVIIVMKVEILDEPLTNENFQENLNQIRNLVLN